MTAAIGLFFSWLGLLGFGAWLAAKGGDAK
jgi:hypothetical protein